MERATPSSSPGVQLQSDRRADGALHAAGFGVIALPTGDPEAAVVTLFALDANGKANHSGFDTVFEGNTTYNLEGRLRTNFAGLRGTSWREGCTRRRPFLPWSKTLRFIIENGAIEQKDHSWAFYYNFDQYLYEPKKGSGQGVGIYGRFGASDGNPNPIHYFYSIGIGGKGILPDRPLDQFGMGITTWTSAIPNSPDRKGPDLF